MESHRLTAAVCAVLQGEQELGDGPRMPVRDMAKGYKILTSKPSQED